ncbi:DODA-type extradiol aromatic ring-opening family dioxygenase [Saccharobesus litoralis]|nr:class III extradiol ring-cleavage dioxygenase [Saccharobesus litoralis]
MSINKNASAPVLFLSHGSPMRLIEPSAATEFLSELPQQLPEIKGIVVISPHWQTAKLSYTSSEQLNPIYDFYGFPPQLSKIPYSVKNPRWLQQTLINQLGQQGLAQDKRGLDHGAWSLLYFMYPKADIPTIGLSLPRDYTPLDLYQLGQQLAPLRQQGILILASGMATHNLSRLNQSGIRQTWADEFVLWLQEKVATQDIDSLINYRTLAPNAATAHPTDEHLLPLFIALGAAQHETSTLLHDSWEFGTANNSCWGWS